MLVKLETGPGWIYASSKNALIVTNLMWQFKNIPSLSGRRKNECGYNGSPVPVAL